LNILGEGSNNDLVCVRVSICVCGCVCN